MCVFLNLAVLSPVILITFMFLFDWQVTIMSNEERASSLPNHWVPDLRKHVAHTPALSYDADEDAKSITHLPTEKTPLLGTSIKLIDERCRSICLTHSVMSIRKIIGSTTDTISTSVRHLKKSVGFLQGFSLIVGILIGSGVFISPSLVMAYTCDAGFAFLVWSSCGMIALGGSLCYCELGCSIKKAGGNYAYILEAYGSLPAFLCSWTVALVVDPSATAAITLTFGTYVMKTFEGIIEPNELFPKLLAAGCILVVAFVNCWSIKAATRAQTLFTFAQIAAVAFIVAIGVWQLIEGRYKDNFEGIFNITHITSVGMIGELFPV